MKVGMSTTKVETFENILLSLGFERAALPVRDSRESFWRQIDGEAWALICYYYPGGPGPVAIFPQLQVTLHVGAGRIHFVGGWHDLERAAAELPRALAVEYQTVLHSRA